MKTPVTNIPIPAILEIKNGAVFSLNQILMQHGFTNALFLFDDFTYNNHRPELLRSITSAKVQDFLMPPDLDILDLVKKSFEFEQFDVVMAMGGGMVIDYGKYMAFVRKSRDHWGRKRPSKVTRIGISSP